MIQTIRILDSSGDRPITWGPVTNGLEAAALEQTRALFYRLLADGHTAFKVNRADGKPDERVRDFSQLEEETIIIPRVIGG